MNCTAPGLEKTERGDSETPQKRWNGRATEAPCDSARLSTGIDKASTFELEALPHLDIVYRVALRLSRDAVQAEDLVQETMLKAYRAWDQYRLGTNVRAWLLTILRNEAFMLHRRRKRARNALESRQIEGVTVFESGWADPEDRFLHQLVADEVIHAIDSLPVEFREAVVLRHVENLSYEEIAQITGVQVGTVKSRLFRGRRLLKRQLRNYVLRQRQGA